ncbi:MAG TPA: glycosyl hydrolase family 39 [Terriglobia bacterium]|nr:glycosyl hydrolase family 39 [Terriglobia bacterium]
MRAAKNATRVVIVLLLCVYAGQPWIRRQALAAPRPIAWLARQSPAARAPAEAPETIAVDAQAPAHNFPHFWERMFGSGRAILSLRDGYRRDLRAVKQATGFEYVRFHAIFGDEVGLYDEDGSGKPVYNFSYVDQIYDGLLENGVRPFVELSFMPDKLAARQSIFPFWYKPNVAPPRDYDHWGDMIEAFTRHLVARYGADEVAQWYFEVWNEPNIGFWAGDPQEATYYQLYDVTARAIKRVDPRFRVGGPSTAQAAWVDHFIQHCVQADVPVDFVSTHVYANDTSQNVFGTSEEIRRDQMVYRAVRKVHDQIKASSRPELPLIISEYNASYMNEQDVTDSVFMGPWLAHNIAQCDGLTEMMSYWTFSDVFEEGGVVKRPFYGGFGLIAAGHIPKASFNAFRMLHELGNRRLALNSDEALATQTPDGRLAVAVWNYAPPGGQGTPKQITLDLRGLGRNQRRVRIEILDRDQGSSLEAWKKMGSPDFPSREQQRELRESARMPAPAVEALTPRNSRVTLNLPGQALALVETEP